MKDASIHLRLPKDLLKFYQNEIESVGLTLSEAMRLALITFMLLYKKNLLKITGVSKSPDTKGKMVVALDIEV